ncbi:membrane associated rhomboid family serine protease [Streptomyces sp. V4I23]|uniref:rhomboid family intramembrane serine protease n=1 Tax=Streptomyces sp. V4I23 TaxID=3042282 RepID=UPI00277F9684|nr:rhomboid family intramembrane serine protease [Streptomyces sp. V4I23]MDQ1009647.1 membrane associated rhomboid family serine protease [Streptomyces sp. V4I23]
MDQAPGSPQEPKDTHGLPGCYRHPGRETGIRCTRCERPICTDCMISASVGFQCPDCVRTGSGTGHAPDANRPRTLAGGTVTADPRLVTKVLLAINLVVFVLGAVNDRLVDVLALVGQWPPAPFLSSEGVAEGEWYRLVTSMFLHQELWHIAFNMLGLWWLGGPLEQALGRSRYLALYLISGLAGSALTYLLADPGQGSLGASGAIFGLLGATMVLMRRLRYDMRPVVALLAINLVITFFWPGIAWQAHVGGLIAGAAIAYGLVHAPQGKRRTPVQLGVCALVLLVSLVVVVARTLALT